MAPPRHTIMFVGKAEDNDLPLLSLNNEEPLEGQEGLGSEGPKEIPGGDWGKQASCIDNVLVGSHLAKVHLFHSPPTGIRHAASLLAISRLQFGWASLGSLGRTGVPRELAWKGSTGRSAPSAALILLVVVLIGLGADLVGQPS
jgi:hypothetical protein